MEDWVLRMPGSETTAAKSELLLTREWLVTNGLGGYASGTLAGVASRRYHSLLVAALPAPLGRRVMLNHLSELLRLGDGTAVRFGGEERAGAVLELHGMDRLAEFRLDMGLPVWRYEVGGIVFEKWILLPHQQNTVHVNYRLVAGEGPVRLELRPAVHFRAHDGPVNDEHAGPYRLTIEDHRYELVASSPSPRAADPQAGETRAAPLPPLRMYLYGQQAAFTTEGKRLNDILYRVEESRGYEYLGALWTPGYFQVNLARDQDATLVASTESWETILALHPHDASEAERERRRRLIRASRPEVRTGPARELVLAADQFIIEPAGRVEDAARAHAAGDEVRTVIAGYHWFTDWGRDTMISLEGLTLVTGRQAEAGYILRTFAHYIRDGLIPNMFPEGHKEGLYHTADATLWFFHALARYLAYTDDRETLRLLLPRLQDIIDHHVRGTRFGIGVDPADGLLRQGAEGYQLTWMDAKVGDWVVTPRRGKAVEINALWYNALRLLEGWIRSEQGERAAQPLVEQAERVRRSFNQRFWYAEGGYLYDVVDGEKGDDPACRPNQIFAIALPYAVLAQERWQPVLDVVQQRLLTPVGLRSLAPGHPDYKPQYYGDLRARDAAYHQGTVWAWLIGPFLDAWLKVHPQEQTEARRFLQGLIGHLSEACIGSISEVFDAEEPFTPRGCIAQAWSVAEVLRGWAKTSG
jgi:predicted glycogen debranching enzyme